MGKQITTVVRLIELARLNFDPVLHQGSGRSARVFRAMDTPPRCVRFVCRMPGHNQIKRTLLAFSGIKPVEITSFGPVRYATPERKACERG